MTALTAREMDVMSVLWDLGSATVNEVSAQLDDDLAYTTVLTVLRILESKGLVGHEREGRAHRYHPLLARREAGRSVLDRLREKGLLRLHGDARGQPGFRRTAFREDHQAPAQAA